MQDSDACLVTARIGCDNRVVLPKEIMEGLQLSKDDRLVMKVSLQDKEVRMMKLEDAIDL